jgi:enoyl-CoA hydratase/carnithine racemase
MPDFRYEKYDTYAIFTMDRQERLNAIGETMLAERAAALEDFTADPKMRAGILTGAGRAFSAGADLKEMAERNEGSRPRAPRRTLETAMPFSRNPKPFIAAINGLCLAGGLEMALDCDIRICSTEAYFGLFEVKRGILAGYAIHHLPRLIPFGEAMYMLLTADRIAPEHALRWGLVHEVVEPDRLLPRAIEIAQMIAANAPLSIEGTKAVAQHWRQLQIDESYRFGAWVSRMVLASEDAKEGPRAFAEKRAPVWKGY